MCPGKWVITSGSGTEVAASCEVTPAGPEHGDFTGADGGPDRRIPVCQIANADVTIIAEVYRRAVGQVKARGDLHGPHGPAAGSSPHGHHQLRGERPGPAGNPVG